MADPSIPLTITEWEVSLILGFAVARNVQNQGRNVAPPVQPALRYTVLEVVNILMKS